MADIGVMAQPTHRPGASWRRCPHCPGPRPRPWRQAHHDQRQHAPATGALQSACAATVETSTNISMVSSDEAVPSWRGQAQGAGAAA
jgi:hypothetical protein